MLKGASRNYVLVYVCCLWFAAGCTPNEPSSTSIQPAELSLHFDEKLVIEEKELSPGDFLILPVSSHTSHGNSQIRTDSEGNIYVRSEERRVGKGCRLVRARWRRAQDRRDS